MEPKTEERLPLPVALLASVLALNLPSAWGGPGVRALSAPDSPGAAEERPGDDRQGPAAAALPAAAEGLRAVVRRRRAEPHHHQDQTRVAPRP